MAGSFFDVWLVLSPQQSSLFIHLVLFFALLAVSAIVIQKALSHAITRFRSAFQPHKSHEQHSHRTTRQTPRKVPAALPVSAPPSVSGFALSTMRPTNLFSSAFSLTNSSKAPLGLLLSTIVSSTIALVYSAGVHLSALFLLYKWYNPLAFYAYAIVVFIYTIYKYWKIFVTEQKSAWEKAWQKSEREILIYSSLQPIFVQTRTYLRIEESQQKPQLPNVMSKENKKEEAAAETEADQMVRDKDVKSDQSSSIQSSTVSSGAQQIASEAESPSLLPFGLAVIFIILFVLVTNTFGLIFEYFAVLTFLVSISTTHGWLLFNRVVLTPELLLAQYYVIFMLANRLRMPSMTILPIAIEAILRTASFAKRMRRLSTSHSISASSSGNSNETTTNETTTATVDDASQADLRNPSSGKGYSSATSDGLVALIYILLNRHTFAAVSLQDFYGVGATVVFSIVVAVFIHVIFASEKRRVSLIRAMHALWVLLDSIPFFLFLLFLNGLVIFPHTAIFIALMLGQSIRLFAQIQRYIAKLTDLVAGSSMASTSSRAADTPTSRKHGRYEWLKLSDRCIFCAATNIVLCGVCFFGSTVFLLLSVTEHNLPILAYLILQPGAVAMTLAVHVSAVFLLPHTNESMRQWRKFEQPRKMLKTLQRGFKVDKQTQTWDDELAAAAEIAAALPHSVSAFAKVQRRPVALPVAQPVDADLARSSPTIDTILAYTEAIFNRAQNAVSRAALSVSHTSSSSSTSTSPPPSPIPPSSSSVSSSSSSTSTSEAPSVSPSAASISTSTESDDFYMVERADL